MHIKIEKSYIEFVRMSRLIWVLINVKGDFYQYFDNECLIKLKKVM